MAGTSLLANTGHSKDAGPITRPETRFNVPRGAILGYHQAQFEESSGEYRMSSEIRNSAFLNTEPLYNG
jgi:hypothetical protein